MKKKSIFIYFFILLFITPQISNGKTKIDEKILFTPYFLQKTSLFFKESNRYTESYVGIGINTAILLNLIILEGFFETIRLVGISKNLGSYYNTVFPESGERSGYSLGSQLGLAFLTSNENLFITSFGLDYINIGNLNYQKTEYNIKYKKLLYTFSITDRFLLFKEAILYTGVRFSFNKDKEGSPLYKGYEEFNNYLITLSIGISFWL